MDNPVHGDSQEVSCHDALMSADDGDTATASPGAHVVVMGVSGTGKTRVGRELADRLGRAVVEGDDLHPAANVENMSAGAPLDDEDRAPWLATLGALLAERQEQGTPVVLTCSALTRAYRDARRGRLPRGAVFFVHLTAPYDVLERRMQERDHFMPPALLRSQLDALEPLGQDEAGAVLDVTAPVEQVVADVLRSLPR